METPYMWGGSAQSVELSEKNAELLLHFPSKAGQCCVVYPQEDYPSKRVAVLLLLYCAMQLDGEPRQSVWHDHITFLPYR
jgi:hypothetical protein